MLVLIADGYVDAATTLGELLEFWRYEVIVVHDGPSALEAAFTYRPQIALIDVNLPEISGYEVACRLRQESLVSRILLIALITYGSADDQRKLKEAGFDYYFLKPVDPFEIRQILWHV
ncbi:MAG TPA: response regulator [Candidatus Limnocylindrales bacterium]|nr:response regulator [Candidatus Limnocylindrales bacterium]